MNSIPIQVQEAHKRAVQALNNSYSPYSQFRVAAALQVTGIESPVVGVNVENASFGGTNCAERSAYFSAISQYGRQNFEFIVIVSDVKGAVIPPCGLCRQIMSEFAGSTFPIYLGSAQQIEKKYTLGELLPHVFDGTSLKG